MTRLHTGTVQRPRWESRPYQPSPARREAIHGRIQGIADRRDPTARIFIIGALVIAGFFALQLLRWWL